MVLANVVLFAVDCFLVSAIGGGNRHPRWPVAEFFLPSSSLSFPGFQGMQSSRGCNDLGVLFIGYWWVIVYAFLHQCLIQIVSENHQLLGRDVQLASAYLTLVIHDISNKCIVLCHEVCSKDRLSEVFRRVLAALLQLAM